MRSIAAILAACMLAGCAAQQPQRWHDWTDLKGVQHHDPMGPTPGESSGWETAGKVVGYTLGAPFIIAGYLLFDVVVPVAQARIDGGYSHAHRDALVVEQQRQADFERQQADQAAQMQRDLEIQRQYNAARMGR